MDYVVYSEELHTAIVIVVEQTKSEKMKENIITNQMLKQNHCRFQHAHTEKCNTC